MTDHAEKLRIHMQKIDGAWFITSPDLKGLCAATSDLGAAIKAALHQIKTLTGVEYEWNAGVVGTIEVYEWSRKS